jgi:hypothetical protein
MLKRLTLPLALACAAAITVAGTVAGSAAASTGSVMYTPEQSGYAASGTDFNEGEYNVTLPNPAKFASVVGRIGFSVQLWAAGQVDDLIVSACTDATCSPGGKAATEKYTLVLDVYNPSKHTLICSTSNGSCPSVPASWKNARLSAGQTASLTLQYIPQPSGLIFASVNNETYNSYQAGTGILFNQARLSAEFAATPWTTAAFKAPSAQTLLGSIGVPVGPPYEAELGTYSGKGGCVDSWTTREIKMTSSGTSSTPAEAVPGSLTNEGCNFGIYAEH